VWQRSRRATGNRRNHQRGDDSILRANVTRDPGSPWPGVMGALVWGVGLAGCRFLCAGKYIALLIEHEWGSPQHPAYEGVKSLGILFMTWRAQGVIMVGYLCSCPGCAVTRHLEQQYDLWHFRVFERKRCMLLPIGGNFWPCLSRVNFSHFLPFNFVVGILEYRSVSWLVIISWLGKWLQCKGVVIYYSFM